MRIKAYILVATDPGQTKNVYDAIKAVPGVVECHEVMGPYDIVAELEVDNLTDVPPILSGRIRAIPGIESTTSLVTFPE
jgi:DNA-binding Lrp family transcriptional regulator